MVSDSPHDERKQRGESSFRFYSPLAEPVVGYMRAVNFMGPEQVKRYYRLFGDLEYDLLALRTESTIMEMRLREVKRRLSVRLWISTEDERAIAAVAHDLADTLHARIDALRTAITAARGFRFDTAREEQCYYLLFDITIAILGMGNRAERERERERLDEACLAYQRLDVIALIDAHDQVQTFLGLERRERLDPEEEEPWRAKLDRYLRTYPLRNIDLLDDPDRIERRTAALRRKISAEQERLEWLAMVYMAAIRAGRCRN